MALSLSTKDLLKKHSENIIRCDTLNLYGGTFDFKAERHFQAILIVENLKKLRGVVSSINSYGFRAWSVIISAKVFYPNSLFMQELRELKFFLDVASLQVNMLRA